MTDNGIATPITAPADVPGMGRSRTAAAYCLFLALTVILVFGGVADHEFIIFDDPTYITHNENVKQGLSRESLLWAVTSFHGANWHPLTWLSHMLDVELFGLNPAAHLWVNVSLHLANSLLLFGFLFRATSRKWPAAAVAFLFAVHPLHVESVAWVAERKDVLSTLFFMLTLHAYLGFTSTPSRERYLVVFTFFLLGLLAKPMLVTLPFVLLLLDIWPLRRVSARANGSWDRATLLRRVKEKLPLFLLSAASCAVTFLAQSKGGAVTSTAVLPVFIRLANALNSYTAYLVKMFWPTRLAVFYPYPHPDTFLWWQVAASAVFLAAVSWVVVRRLPRQPFLAVGWFWYLGTLVPVIGLVQVGSQSLADRYTYIPLVGVFICLAWSADALRRRGGVRRFVLDAAALAAVLVLAVLSRQQVGHWENSQRLFTHTLSVTSDNAMAHHSYACALDMAGMPREAEKHFRKAIAIKPRFSAARSQLAVLLAASGKKDEAMELYTDLLADDPDLPKLRFNYANLLMDRNRVAEAVDQYEKALASGPAWAGLHNNAGIAWVQLGRPERALFHFDAAIRMEPDFVDARYNRKGALEALERLEEREAQVLAAVSENPEDGHTLYRAGRFFKDRGELEKAKTYLEKALALDPDHVEAAAQLARTLAMRGEFEAAVALLGDMAERYPRRWEEPYLLAGIHARSHRKDLSLQWLSEALRRGFSDGERLRGDPNLRLLQGEESFHRLIQRYGLN